MTKLTGKELKKLFVLTHKEAVLKITVSRMPFAYMNEDAGQMVRDIKMRSKLEKVEEELREETNRLYEKYGEEGFMNTFNDPDYIQQNKFTFEDQKAASKEAIGRAITLEDLLAEGA